MAVLSITSVPGEGVDAATGAAHFSSRKALVRNTVVNFIGLAAPLLVALFCIPILIRSLGDARFGILGLAYALLGYTSLLDLGMGRSLTKMVAEHWNRSDRNPVEIASLVWTSLSLMFGLGIAGMLGLAALSPLLVDTVVKVGPDLRVETVRAFYWIALSLPFVITTSGLRGVFEAQQRFHLSSFLRILAGVLTFAAPILVLPFSHGLVAVMMAVVAGRMVVWAFHFLICLNVTPELRHHFHFRKSWFRPLLSFGGWVSVNAVAGSLTLTLDRFVIAAVLSAAAVTYYATPYEMITKLWLVTGAFGGVLFPAFAALSSQDFARARRLYHKSCRYASVALLPATLLVAIFAKGILTLWLGAEFAARSLRVAELLAIGTFFLGLGTIPWTWLQGLGRSDIPAILNLVELPPYVLALWLMTRYAGIEGTAIVWGARALVDTAATYLFAERLIGGRTPNLQSAVQATVSNRRGTNGQSW